MGFFTIRKKMGNEYVYYEDRGWKDGKVIRTFQKYLGPRAMFPDIPIGKNNSHNLKDCETQTYEFGISASLWQIVQQLNLIEIINTAIGQRPESNTGYYLILSAINRVAAPCSKSQLSSWFEHDWLSLQIPDKGSILTANVHWQNSLALNATHYEQIELALGKLLQEKFHLANDQLLYDATNFFTYATPDPEGLRRFGHSKQNQNGLPLIQFFLLCSKPWGFPLLHHTYAGNTQDAEAFKAIPSVVTEHWTKLGYVSENITLSFDKGNLSQEAFKDLDDRNLKFVASLRNSTQKDLLSRPRSEFKRVQLPKSGKYVEYLQVEKKIYDRNRTVIVVIDPAKQEKHRHKMEEQITKKYNLLQEFITNQLNIKKWRDKTQVETKLGTIIGKRPWKSILKWTILGQYEQWTVTITIDEKAKADYLNTLGRSIIFTNLEGKRPEEIIWAYREQYLIERAFSLMKDPQTIAVRPVFHSTAPIIEEHVFICILALWLMALLRYTLMKKGLQISFDSMIRDLRRLHLTKIDIPRSKESILKIDKGSVRTKKYVSLFHLNKLLSEG